MDDQFVTHSDLQRFLSATDKRAPNSQSLKPALSFSLPLLQLTVELISVNLSLFECSQALHRRA